MKFVALLRGINVGGNSMVKMLEIKKVLSEEGFTNVSSYINSGNILFESDTQDTQKLEAQIETLLLKNFFSIKTVVFSQKDIENVLEKIPLSWKKDNLRKYIAFIKSPSTPENVIEEAQLKEGIDFIEKGHRVVYMSTEMEGITKSNFPKLASKKIYKEITIRNYTTVEKLAVLMKN